MGREEQPYMSEKAKSAIGRVSSTSAKKSTPHGLRENLFWSARGREDSVSIHPVNWNLLRKPSKRRVMSGLWKLLSANANLPAKGLSTSTNAYIRVRVGTKARWHLETLKKTVNAPDPGKPSEVFANARHAPRAKKNSGLKPLAGQ